MYTLSPLLQLHSTVENSMNIERQPRITTLERFIAPPGLDGEYGLNRLSRGGKSINADNDVEAVRLWLSTLINVSDATVRIYRSTAEKLLNWSCFSRGKALSSLDDADLDSLVEFLAAPRPALDWICRASVPRNSQHWRPFRGPLALASVRQLVSTASSLFDWLGVVGYAAMPSISKARAVRLGAARQGVVANISAIGMRRTLSVEAWIWVTKVLISGVELRSRLAVELIYFANLKVEEISQLRLSDCVAPSSDCVCWRLQVDSMTNRLRCVYLLPPVGASLSQVFETHTRLPSASLSAPEIRQGSELLFDESNGPAQCIKKILRRSADIAGAGGDTHCSEELRGATLTCFRGALESHAGSDQAFILGFVANARDSRCTTANYFRGIVLNTEAITTGWTRLAKQWKPYSELLSLRQ